MYAKSKFSTAQMRKLRPKDLKPVVPGRELTEAEKAERRRAADDSYERVKQARSHSHWSQYDPVRVVNAVS